jgi:hypothetical protein
MANINRTSNLETLICQPESSTNEGETHFTAFCTRISTYVDDKINYAFTLAFTTSPDGVPQPHVIPNDDNDEMDEV